MHTPAKGAGPNKGLGGSNPPFSAITLGRKLTLSAFFLIQSLIFKHFQGSPLFGAVCFLAKNNRSFTPLLW